MITVIVGNIIVGFMCVLSGAPGAKWHIGFPIIQRASWGTRGYVFVVIQRFFLACIWFSTQVYWGGQCLRVLLTSMWPSFRHLDKPLANGTMTTGDFTAFILFTILYLPLCWISPEKYKMPFLVCCACIIPTVFALLIWCTVMAQGGGDLLHDVSAAGVVQATGSNLAWMYVLGICTNISSISVHIYVQSDYTRYARRPRDQILAQLVMVPLGTIGGCDRDSRRDYLLADLCLQWSLSSESSAHRVPRQSSPKPPKPYSGRHTASSMRCSFTIMTHRDLEQLFSSSASPSWSRNLAWS